MKSIFSQTKVISHYNILKNPYYYKIINYLNFIPKHPISNFLSEFVINDI